QRKSFMVLCVFMNHFWYDYIKINKQGLHQARVGVPCIAIFKSTTPCKEISVIANFRSKFRGLAFCALAATILASPVTSAHAGDDYPSRPISLVLGYPPGGAVDFVSRVIARNLETTLKQSVVVENRPGAGSLIGTGSVVRSKPDGYTLLLADPALIINPSLMPSVPYNVERDLVPISSVTLSPLVLVVPSSSPLQKLDDLIKAGKGHNTGLNFASAGQGTTPHMAGELLKLRAGPNLVHTPYRGSGPAMTDLVAGQVDFAFATQPAAVQYISNNRLRGLATTGPERSK